MEKGESNVTRLSVDPSYVLSSSRKRHSYTRNLRRMTRIIASMVASHMQHKADKTNMNLVQI